MPPSTRQRRSPMLTRTLHRIVGLFLRSYLCGWRGRSVRRRCRQSIYVYSSSSSSGNILLYGTSLILSSMAYRASCSVSPRPIKSAAL